MCLVTVDVLKFLEILNSTGQRCILRFWIYIYFVQKITSTMYLAQILE